jgi:hypothetical protein
MQRFILLITLFGILGCSSESKKEGFTLLSKSDTGLDFRNMLNETENFNIFKYQYFYNGGGVAVADYNNDGLEDIFFTGNMVKNRLFINDGNLSFSNITEESGVALHEGWCTGANAIDVNNDGWMDIYVCRAGYPFEKLRHNLLLINNKDNTFTDKAKEYGIDDPAYSTHSSFFDYDNDGDLDLFLVNHSTPEYSKGNLEVMEMQKISKPETTNKLYRREGDKYIDVSVESGIKGNVLSFSLGVATVDINDDQWTDIYVTNDFNEPDYIYINNGDGTFTEDATSYLMNQSKFSMGVDFADVDQNGMQDLVVLDMLPESNKLQKLHMGADNFDKIDYFVKSGFQRQHSRNTLQLNYPNTPMSEVGQGLGISNTDWSWCPLFFDFDNDSKQDLFISNGYLKDHTDLDFLQYTADLVQKLDREGKDEYKFEDYVASMPPILQPNYFYSKEDEKFANNNVKWGLNSPSVSQGAAYADFDNDGDLDLVTSNSGSYAYFYENNQTGSNWVSLKLRGGGNNKNAIGAKVSVHTKSGTQIKYIQPSRGFQSSSSYILHFGLGEHEKYESIDISWPDGTQQVLVSGSCCQVLNVEYNLNSNNSIPEPIEKKIMADLNISSLELEFKHILESQRDFNIQSLMPFYQSDISPLVAVADINGDGMDDIIVSGSEHNETKMFFQKKNGDFEEKILLQKGYHVSDIQMIDIDDDKRKDVLLSIGSYAHAKDGKRNKVVIFYQKNKNSFLKEEISLSATNPSSIAVADVDEDGDMDIFCGGTYWQGSYPASSVSCFLFQKKGEFTEMSVDLGNIQDVEVTNLVNKKPTLLTVGHWNYPRFIEIDNGKIHNVTSKYMTDSLTGFWNSITIVESEPDSDIKILLGNMGTNSQLKVFPNKPIKIMYNDVDENGSIDPIMSNNVQGECYPHASREDLLNQIPGLKKMFKSFEDYGELTFDELIVKLEISNPKMLEVSNLEHMMLVTDGNQFKPKALPVETQMSPIYDAVKSSSGELVLVGNKSKNLTKIGNLNNSQGKILELVSFSSKTNENTMLSKEFRSISSINIGGKKGIVLCPVGGTLSIQFLTHDK